MDYFLRKKLSMDYYLWTNFVLYMDYSSLYIWTTFKGKKIARCMGYTIRKNLTTL